MSEPIDNSIWATAMKVLPGFLGSVVAAIYLQRPTSKTEGLVAILSGAFTAVFVTPYVVSLVAPGNPHAYAGIGYGIGMSTVILLPPIMRRLQELVAQMTISDFLGGIGKKKE